MNRKKTSSKFPQKWWLLVVLVALLIGYLVWRSVSSDTAPVDATAPSTVEQTDAKPIASSSVTGQIKDPELNELTPLNNEIVSEDSDLDNNSINQPIDPKLILDAPLPKTNSLAKEEIDRLEDERQRMAEQEKLAAEQLAMNKKLTEMKAEQIALLEQQIVELEANETAVE
ncbi:hypothetical protein FW759_10165 [Psychrobacter sp. 1176_08]|uniref:hypothetical protein n=1 Tax=Psychrobacter sp. 1176_08 TaxID=2604452 RepID=UPI0040631D43